jgi:hypothetical protein
MLPLDIPTATPLPHHLTQRGFLGPRTLAIFIVMLGLLVIPLWWNKRNKDAAKVAPQVAQRPATTSAKQAASPNAQAPAVASTASPTNSASPDRLGLSLGHGKFTTASDVTRLLHSSCTGEPRADNGACDAIAGDSSCRTALPILCILKDGSAAQASGLTIVEAKPATTTASVSGTTTAASTTATASATAAMTAEAEVAEQLLQANQLLQASWVGGTLGATAPVAGFVIGSLANGNARCVKELGTGWRMAEIHDAASGKGLVGKRGQGLVNTDTRHWVHAKDQKANCWD